MSWLKAELIVSKVVDLVKNGMPQIRKSNSRHSMSAP